MILTAAGDSPPSDPRPRRVTLLIDFLAERLKRYPRGPVA